jgi:predicted O-methyltransferase YrrM
VNDDRIALAKTTLGYLHDSEGRALERYALECDGPFVEIGSFVGKSTIWIGAAAEARETVVYAIDPHHGNPECQPGRECFIEGTVDPRTGRVDTLPLLRDTLERAGLADVVIPVAGSSITVGQWWETQVGFVFVDGDHDGGVRDDERIWHRHVRPGGYLCFHDSDIPAIRHACQAAVDHGFEQVDHVASLKVFRRPPC